MPFFVTNLYIKIPAFKKNIIFDKNIKKLTFNDKGNKVIKIKL